MDKQTISPTQCPSCNEIIADDDNHVVECQRCNTRHHQHCWDDNGGCQEQECSATNSWRINDSPLVATVVPFYRHPFFPWLLTGSIIILLIMTALLSIKYGIHATLVLTIAVVIAALVFDYVNGMHDAGNAIATVISTRVLPPVVALIMAAILNLLGALVYSGVATSIATKFADSSVAFTDITPLMILCGLIGASVWSFWTARIGLPVSTSHSLFGGLIGVFLLGGIKLNAQYMAKLGFWMICAPLLAFVVGWALMTLMNWFFQRAVPSKVNRHFRVLQVFSSALMAFSHGSNDAQKAMGIITLALLSSGLLHFAPGVPVTVPLWVKVSCALVIALGTGLGGMRVIRTLGHKIIKLEPIHGFVAETVASATIQLVTLLHIPISTTHVISSSILGIGASRRLSSVRWGIALNIVTGWFFTIPTCAAAGALLYALVSHLSHMK